MNQQHIIEEIKKGNQKIINDIYKEYRNQFVAFAYNKYNVQAEMAKEIYQDSFVAFYKNVVSGKLVRLDADLKTYLFQIGRNLINNEFRREKKIDKSVEVPRLRVVDETDGATAETRHEMMQKAVSESIKELTESCYKLLTMFYFEKRKYEDLMELFDYKNVESIKTQKYKCLKKLELIIKSKYTKEELLS